ncbi:MAG: ATP-binding protein [Erysipelotrichaceae bacterium]|nr:ATP-binding protein [Erysipelotrichaceae bacterium]
MRRHIEDKLQVWYNSENKKPLIIKGARQVGKTYSIRDFAKKNYKYLVEINFEKQLELSNLFGRTRNPKEILDYLQLSYLDVPFDSNTLLFLDEIQACSHALIALKFLAEEFPTDIICSGSVLGVAIATTTSFPVGYVETWEMNPLTFTEFLWALGIGEDWLTRINDTCKNLQPLNEPFHQKMNEFFRNYVVIGGMPEVVKTFIQTKSYKEALSVQRRIVQDYTNDMAKYASGSDRIKTRECFESIPLQLAKENKKFQYKIVREGYNARYYESSLRWLEESGLIIKVNRLNQVTEPLEANIELAVFKVYMMDTGLLISQFNEGVVRDLLTGELGIYKGAIYESIVAQMLNVAGKRSFYYQPNNNAEIDFIIYYEGHMTPVEVKSSGNTHSISFSNFVKHYKPSKAFRISLKNIGKNDEGNIVYLPIYMLETLLANEHQIVE